MSIAPKNSVAIALAGAGMLAAAKLGAVLQDGSSAMLASTVQSLIDLSFLTLLIYGLSSHAEPGREGADDRGFWTAIVPILLYALGAGVTLYDGIEHIARPRTSAGFAYDEILLAVGIAVSCTTLWLNSRPSGNKGEDEDVRADEVRAALTVQAASAAIGHVAAFGGVVAASRWQLVQADGIAAALVGLILISVAAVMAVAAGRILRGRGTLHLQSAVASAPIARATLDAARAPETKSMPAVHSEQIVDVVEPPATPVKSPPPQLPASPSGKPQVVVRHQGKKGRGKRHR